jgi:hypothetical protein
VTEPTIIRCSTLPRYGDCARRVIATTRRKEMEAAGYKLRPVRIGISAVKGTSVHSGAGIPLQEKARTGKLPPPSVATDAAVETLHDQLRHEVQYDGPRGLTHSPREAERQVVAMTLAYYRVVAPQVDPIHVEERFEAEVEPGLILSGQPDVIAREPNAVRDLKSGARPPSSFAAQIGGYSLLARSNHLQIELGRIDYVRHVAVNKPQPDPVTLEVPIGVAETAASSILKHIAGDLATFRYGDPERRILPGDPWAFVANPTSMLCSPKYCPAFGSDFCHEGDPSKGEK